MRMKLFVFFLCLVFLSILREVFDVILGLEVILYLFLVCMLCRCVSMYMRVYLNVCVFV